MSDRMSPIDNQSGRTALHRDNQQWVFDYLVKETGRTHHFQGDGRGDLPRSVRNHSMIPKHVARRAQQLEELGRLELAAGHPTSALGYYFEAAIAYGRAQHPIFELSAEKRFLYASLRRCYDQVCELAPYPLEHLDIPWNGTAVSGNLHINPNLDGPGPLMFLLPGCDVFKEVYPHPLYNFGHQRGMHVFSFDGPGMAESNLRGIRLTADNFEDAASVALDHLLQRPEMDPSQVVVYANSFGTFWGLRFAARDQRIRAIAAPQVSICAKYIQTDIESPRWKQLFAFLTQSTDEDELDAHMRAMTMEDYLERINCPVLMTVGEYDPRAPLDELYPLFDQLTAPAELWVMEDQHHMLKVGHDGDGWSKPTHGLMADWLADRLQGKPLAHPGQVLFVSGDKGPLSPSVRRQRTWFGDPGRSADG